MKRHVNSELTSSTVSIYRFFEIVTVYRLSIAEVSVATYPRLLSRLVIAGIRRLSSEGKRMPVPVTVFSIAPIFILALSTIATKRIAWIESYCRG